MSIPDRPDGFWDTRYGGTDDYVFGTAPAAPLQRIRDHLPASGRALAIADGEGRNSVWLAEQGFDVTAFDASPVGLAKARGLAEQRGVTIDFHAAEIGAWDWDAPGYDLVAGIFFQFLSPIARAETFAGLKRALAPGGTLYILGYRPEQVGRGTGGPPDVENMYTEDLLREAFGVLDILRLESWDEDLDEGTGHKGSSALIELLARKAT